MKNVLEYKGYHTRLEIDAESFTIRGKIEGINDYVDFQSTSLAEIEQEFQSAVDDYLEFCREVGKEPDKEYKGTFNVRISPELHKRLAVRAFKNGDSLNATVEKAISEYLSEVSQTAQTLKETLDSIVGSITESAFSLPQYVAGISSSHGKAKPCLPKTTRYNCMTSQ